MKILIVSDSHGYINNVVDYIENNEKPDMIFHLGDYVKDGIEIYNKFNIPTKIVRGNGDYMEKEFKYEEIVQVNDKKILLSHGHKYNINFSLDRLLYRGRELEVDYILFGHTHIAFIDKIKDIIVMNPGSSSRPRGHDKKNTIGLINIGNTREEKIIKIN